MADNERLSFSLKILDETKPTSDNRYFVPDTVTWRPLPISLMAIRSNSPDGGHKGSTAIGAITDVWRQNGSIYGRGEFSDDETASEFIPLIEQGVLAGVSADVVGAKREVELAEDGESSTERINGGEIAAVTVLPIPAYDDTRIVVASAGPVNPPAEWFAAPALDTKPYALTVDADGRVHGFAASWDSCHIGKPDTCIQPPKSRSNYAAFQIGEVITEEGTRVPTGTITMATNHAAVTLNARQAVEHYDHTGAAVADVAVHELDHGIYFAGSLRPDVAPERIREFAGSGVSGDWRRINGALDLVGILAVNTPGFPVPRAKYGVDPDNTQTSLVAAGIVDDAVELADCGCDDTPLPDNNTDVTFSDSEELAGKPSPLTDDETSGEPGEEKGEVVADDEESEKKKKNFAASVARTMAIVEVSSFYNRHHGANGRFTNAAGSVKESGRVGRKGSAGEKILYPKMKGKGPKFTKDTGPGTPKAAANRRIDDHKPVDHVERARKIALKQAMESGMKAPDAIKHAAKAAETERKFQANKAKKDAERANIMHRVAEKSAPPRKNDRVGDTGDNNIVKDPARKVGGGKTVSDIYREASHRANQRTKGTLSQKGTAGHRAGLAAVRRATKGK